ncbi:glycosyltransferase family 8 protein [Nostoc sp. NIES-2111]
MTGLESATAINVVFCVDGEFCQHLCVTLASLLVNNPSNAFRIFVIYDHVETDSLSRVQALANQYANCEVELCRFDSAPYRAFRLDAHISLASYFRIFLPKLIPERVDRVLYLDSDLIIRSDVSDLLSIDLNGAYLAGVSNVFSPENAARLGLPASAFYFNAGVLVINLQYWREKDVSARLVDYVVENADILKFHDQDALNAVMHGKVRELDYVWNFQARTRPQDMPAIGRHPADYDAVANSARIIHFTTAQKPWYYRHDVAFKDEYYKYLKLTPFSDYRPPDFTLSNFMRKQIKALIRMGSKVGSSTRTIGAR